jgi:hypothetical protein
MRRNLHMQGETHGDGDQTDIDDVSVHHNHNCPCEERWRKLKILVFEGTDAYGKGEAKLSNLGVFVSCYPILFPIIIVMCLCNILVKNHIIINNLPVLCNLFLVGAGFYQLNTHSSN